jgi:hypothetical protein
VKFLSQDDAVKFDERLLPRMWRRSIVSPVTPARLGRDESPSREVTEQQ